MCETIKLTVLHVRNHYGADCLACAKLQVSGGGRGARRTRGAALALTVLHVTLTVLHVALTVLYVALTVLRVALTVSCVVLTVLTMRQVLFVYLADCDDLLMRFGDIKCAPPPCPQKHESQNTKPETRIPNPDSRIPNPGSRIPNPESRIPNPESTRFANIK